MTFHSIKFFCEKDGHSKRENKELINLHLQCVFFRIILSKTATNSSNNGYFPPHIT